MVSKTSSDELIGLLLLLEEEFREDSAVRIRPVGPTTFRRSPDLPQDYDPQSATLHRVSGVRVLTRNREYFFPEDWVSGRSRSQIFSQIQEIRDQREREG